MAWVRFDDGFAEHPKLLDVGPLGLALQVAAICYCNRELTNGFVHRSKAATLLDFEGLADWRDVAKGLEAAGVWEPVERGWLVHDYLAYQPSREEVVEAREGTERRRSEAGRKAAQARWARRDVVAGDAQDANALRSHEQRTANALRTQSDRNAPNPNPNPKEQDQPQHPSGAAPASARARPRRRLPDDWQPNDRHADLARELDVDLQRQREAFRDYWRSEGRPKADWDAAFRTWLRKSADDRRPRAPSARDPGYRPGDLRAAADHLRAQGR